MDSQARGVCLSCQRRIERTYSSGRISNVGSRRRSSLSVSRDGSSRISADVPDECIAQAGDSGRVDDDYRTRRSTSFEEEVDIRSKQDSNGRLGRRGSWRLGSISSDEKFEDGIFEDLENGASAQAGDCGDRVVGGDQHDGSGSLTFQTDNLQIVENGTLILPDAALVESHCYRVPVKDGCAVSPLTSEAVSPLPTDAILYSGERNINSSVMQISRNTSLKEKQQKLPGLLDYISFLNHLAVCGILGVLARYLLRKLFGPGVLSLTSNNSPLYPDLLANMVGSFLMGWFGIVFKEDVRHVSDHLAVALTTGFLGSLTTFSGWNQKMVELSSQGHWVFAMAGIVIGMWAVDRSIDMGVWTAGCVRQWLLCRFKQDPDSGIITPENWRINSTSRHGIMLCMMLLTLGGLWGLSGTLARKLLDDVSVGAELWLACLAGPPGVWSRWYLARLNGQGLGKKGYLRWLPVGTLLANFLAACMMAALSTIAKAVNTNRCDIIVGALQLGFMGCLSTVSTFAAELFAMRRIDREGRAVAYAATTFLSSFTFGTLIYSVPVWTKHYH